MDWKKVFLSGGKGFWSAIIGLLVSFIPQLQEFAVGLIPEEYAQLTIAGVVAFIFNAVRNWLKHRTD